MNKQYVEGDLVVVTLTGKVERVRGDAVVINAHGVEIPVLASQINTPMLAQKILEIIERAEKEMKRADVSTPSRLWTLREEIKQLCQEEVNKQ